MITTDNSAFNSANVEALHEVYPDLDKDLILKQVELEELMRAEGMMRQEHIIEQAQAKGLESSTSYGTLLLRERVNTLAKEVDVLLDGVRKGQPGFARSHLRLIQNLDSKITAYITLKTLIDSLARPSTLQYVAIGISTVLEDEMRYQSFRENAKKDFKWAIIRALKNTTYQRRRNAMNTMMQHKAQGAYDGVQHEELAWQSWTQDEKIGIGVRLINIAIGCTGIAETRLYASNAQKNVYFARSVHPFRAGCATVTL